VGCGVGAAMTLMAQPSQDSWSPNRVGAPDRFAKFWGPSAPAGSMQCRFVFVFENGVRYTMLFELLTLPIHLFKNTLARQFGLAATLTEPNPCVFSE
jgi:hypothetical protein